MIAQLEPINLAWTESAAAAALYGGMVTALVVAFAVALIATVIIWAVG